MQPRYSDQAPGGSRFGAFSFAYDVSDLVIVISISERSLEALQRLPTLGFQD